MTFLVGPREKIVMAVMVHGPSTLHQLLFWPGCETLKYYQSLLEGTGRVGKPVGINRLRRRSVQRMYIPFYWALYWLSRHDDVLWHQSLRKICLLSLWTLRSPIPGPATVQSDQLWLADEENGPKRRHWCMRSSWEKLRESNTCSWVQFARGWQRYGGQAPQEWFWA